MDLGTQTNLLLTTVRALHEELVLALSSISLDKEHVRDVLDIIRNFHRRLAGKGVTLVIGHYKN